MKKKFLSLALALVFAFALVPTVVTYAAAEIPPSATLPAYDRAPSFDVMYVIEWNGHYFAFSNEPIGFELGGFEYIYDEATSSIISVQTYIYTFALGTRTAMLDDERMDAMQMGMVRYFVGIWYLPPLAPGEYSNWSIEIHELTADFAGMVIDVRYMGGVAGGQTPLRIRIDTGDIPTQAPNLTTASTWAHNYINTAYNANLIPPQLQNLYTQAATRAEFAALAVRLYETVTGRTITQLGEFTDTDDINVRKAAGIGVVGGMGDGTFAPNNTLTREQAAAMISRLANAIGQPLPAHTSTFADNAQVSSWATAYVGQMQASGIMGGVGDNRFAPQADYTREASITTFVRLYNILN